MLFESFANLHPDYYLCLFFALVVILILEIVYIIFFCKKKEGYHFIFAPHEGMTKYDEYSPQYDSAYSTYENMAVGGNNDGLPTCVASGGLMEPEAGAEVAALNMGGALSPHVFQGHPDSDKYSALMS